MSNRKLFKFYLSYYEVAKELPEKERLQYIWAILERQFEGIEPDLKGLAKLAYISQKHSIDAQVKGWEDKTGIELFNPMQGGVVAPKKAPLTEEKEKEKEEEKYSFDTFWNLYDKKVGNKDLIQKKWNKLSDKDQKSILEYLPRYISAQPDKKYRKNPDTFLNQKGWEHEIIGEQPEKKEIGFSALSLAQTYCQ